MRGVAFRVSGKVQGVGFRAAATRAAVRHGVTGWVKNHDDGTVVGEAWQSEEALEEFRAELGIGSKWARVESVVFDDLPSGSEAPASFDVRY